MEYEHKGIKILLTSGAEFRATVDGKTVHKASLSAMKKHIDERLAEQNAFEPFDAIIFTEYTDELRMVRVTGIERTKGRRSYKNYDEWKVTGDKRITTARAVVRDTPENRRLVEAAICARKTLDDERKRLEKVHREALAKINHCRPE